MTWGRGGPRLQVTRPLARLSAYSVKKAPGSLARWIWTLRRFRRSWTRTCFAGGQEAVLPGPRDQLYLLGTGTMVRYYDPDDGRFLNEDPIRQASGDIT